MDLATPPCRQRQFGGRMLACDYKETKFKPKTWEFSSGNPRNEELPIEYYHIASDPFAICWGGGISQINSCPGFRIEFKSNGSKGHVCLLVCLLACLLVCLLACLHVCLLACLLACLRACLLACLCAYLLACLHVCLHLHACSLSCLLVCLLGCLIACSFIVVFLR